MGSLHKEQIGNRDIVGIVGLPAPNLSNCTRDRRPERGTAEGCVTRLPNSTAFLHLGLFATRHNIYPSFSLTLKELEGLT
jgi:hypothetical protein